MRSSTSPATAVPPARRARRARRAASRLAVALLAALAPAGAAGQGSAAARADGAVSAPVSDVRYTVTFDRTLAAARRVRIAMRFTTPGDAPVILSLPAWTPGAYEISNFARWVSRFTATAGERSLAWDKLDPDTWRIHPAGARDVTVRFEYTADQPDNAMTWSRPDFLLLNGTTVFPYPEGRGFDWGATVTVETEPEWLVATGMAPAGAARTHGERGYHDLVDMPFFVGRFDLDSMRVADRWVRLATYPAGSVAGERRRATWDQLARIIPTQGAVFGEIPFDSYTVLQIADPAFAGLSALEHANSHVATMPPAMLGHPIVPVYYAHEVFHAWNVKRLRPADLWPYRYDRAQLTPWLWMAEGITDYYADLTQVRGGIADSARFLALTADKIQDVLDAPPTALEDASLETWIAPTDGSAYLYYPKGALVGLLLDIAIRDASDNRRSLDDVMRALWRGGGAAGGRAFSPDEWWRAVSAAAGGRSFDDWSRRYIDGREPLPWGEVFPLAGLRAVVDTLREPRIGVNTIESDQGLVVTTVDPNGSGASAGVRPGDVLLAIGEIVVTEPEFPRRFTARYGGRDGAPVTIRVRRGEEIVALEGRIRLVTRYAARVEALRDASPKAARIRAGILRGRVDR
jgi:predicted metalloprotease with PDZ domain